MSFLDFFFPEQAQAEYLRQIATNQSWHIQQAARERFLSQRAQRQDSRSVTSLEKRIDELQRDLDQAGLLIEALLQVLEEKQIAARDELCQRAIQIDSADGVQDGRITPPPQEPFHPKRTWNDASAPKPRRPQ